MHEGLTATIDLTAVTQNYRSLQKRARGSAVAAVLKANAYGLGAWQISRALQTAGCKFFYTAHFSEAVDLAPTMPNGALAALNGVPAGYEHEALDSGIVPVISDPSMLERMRNFAKAKGHSVAVMLHADTGINRLGFTKAEWARLVDDATLTEGLTVKVVMSHLACADEPKHPLNAEQKNRFQKIAKRFPAARKSLANSFGIFLGTDYHFDECRTGRALYGVSLPESELVQVVKIAAPILQVRTLDEDSTVGYGATRKAAKGTRLATLGAGYADGVMRALGTAPSAVFYLGGIAAPVVGRISMDLTVIDVTNVPEALAQAGAEVELVGPHQHVDVLAASAGTIGYEWLTNISPRVKRSYIKSHLEEAGAKATEKAGLARAAV